MRHFKYLIVGGGMTADAAVRGIREVDSSGSVGVISAEAVPPYDRPPLSKGLWRNKALETIWRGTDEVGADLLLDRTIDAVDIGERRATDNRGDVFGFERLLLATGGRPNRLPRDQGNTIYFRNLDDYERLRADLRERKRFGVIGGGFIGSELAAALADNGGEVVLLFPEEGIGARQFPRDLSLALNDYYRQRGVEVRPGETVADLLRREGHTDVMTKEGVQIRLDGVVAGLGIRPNVELAAKAGLRVDDGIVVDQFLRTTHLDVYAAGDVASFYCPPLEGRVRVEHEDNANTMGKVAGRNMAGETSSYEYLPSFYSDLFDLGYEAVGELNPELEIVSDWDEPYRKGVVYYLREGRVRGVLLWNVWDQVGAARRLISEMGPFRPNDLRGRLPE